MGESSGDPMMSFPEVGRVRDLISYLDIGRNAAYELVASGRIRALFVGKSIRITRNALEEFLQNGSDPTVSGEAAVRATLNRQEEGDAT